MSTPIEASAATVGARYKTPRGRTVEVVGVDPQNALFVLVRLDPPGGPVSKISSTYQLFDFPAGAEVADVKDLADISEPQLRERIPALTVAQLEALVKVDTRMWVATLVQREIDARRAAGLALPASSPCRTCSREDAPVRATADGGLQFSTHVEGATGMACRGSGHMVGSEPVRPSVAPDTTAPAPSGLPDEVREAAAAGAAQQATGEPQNTAPASAGVLREHEASAAMRKHCASFGVTEPSDVLQVAGMVANVRDGRAWTARCTDAKLCAVALQWAIDAKAKATIRDTIAARLRALGGSLDTPPPQVTAPPVADPPEPTPAEVALADASNEASLAKELAAEVAPKVADLDKLAAEVSPEGTTVFAAAEAPPLEPHERIADLPEPEAVGVARGLRDVAMLRSTIRRERARPGGPRRAVLQAASSALLDGATAYNDALRQADHNAPHAGERVVELPDGSRETWDGNRMVRRAAAPDPLGALGVALDALKARGVFKGDPGVVREYGNEF